MIRIENRCDRVRIASYAPLFCNEITASGA